MNDDIKIILSLLFVFYVFNKKSNTYITTTQDGLLYTGQPDINNTTNTTYNSAWSRATGQPYIEPNDPDLYWRT